MNSSRMAKITLNSRLDGRGRLGRHLNGLLDQAETGLARLNWWHDDDDDDDDDVFTLARY